MIQEFRVRLTSTDPIPVVYVDDCADEVAGPMTTLPQVVHRSNGLLLQTNPWIIGK